jgi:hypothetical protein
MPRLAESDPAREDVIFRCSSGRKNKIGKMESVRIGITIL